MVEFNIMGMRRAILTTILMAVHLVIPTFVDGSTRRIPYISRGTTRISTSNRDFTILSLFETHRIPRGGAISSGRIKGKNGSVYLKALDDEITWLEQQLRRVEQETRALKTKFAKRQQIREELIEESKSKSKERWWEVKNVLDKQEEGLLRLANIEQLEKQKESLLAVKGQLEAIKNDYDQKLQALQSDLSRKISRNDNLEKTFLARARQLEKSIQKVRDTASNSMIHNDPDLSKKIEEACNAAITEFWVEGNRKLQEHERQLKAKFEQELLDERRLATLAVDKQRQKMRALVRDAAIREKENAAKAKQLSRQLAQAKPKQSGTARKNQTSKSQTDKKRDEQKEREKRNAIREEAERKAREEEQEMWLELERELQLERDRLQRMKQRDEEEIRRREQEEMERRRLLQQHTLDMEERLRQEQKKAAADAVGGNGSNGWRLFGSRKKENGKIREMPDPSIASIENYQRRVMWQPISLPPKEVVRITGPSVNH